MWLRRCLIGISALFMFIAVANAREWMNATGTQKYEAEFVELQDGYVKLRLQNGTLVSIPLNDLSPKGKDFALQSAAAQEKTDASGFGSVATEIEKSVVALGYPKSTADDLVRLVRGWKCGVWKQKLAQTRAASSSGQTAEVARVEEEVAKGLYETIGRKIAPNLRYFHLSEVVRDKKAQCLGYSQLFYVVGNSVGITVQVINVLELASRHLQAGESHVACLVSLSNDKVMIVDLAQRQVSEAFVFKDVYVEDGRYWKLKQTNTTSKIHPRIQVLNERGVVSQFYNNLAEEYRRAGDRDHAISYLTKAVELNPTFAQAFVNRGATYYESGQAAKAMPDFNKAIELNPAIAEGYYNRAVLNGELGQRAKTIPDLTKAIELNQQYVEAYCARAAAYISLGKMDEAKGDLKKALALNPALKERIDTVSKQFNLGL